MECPTDGDIAAFVAGELASDDAVHELHAHLDVCASCREVVAEFARTSDDSPRVQKIGRFRIVSILGTGAMGLVYRAHDPTLDRDIALKMLAPGGDATLLAAEAQALAKLAHPNVTHVYEADVSPEGAYLVMELVEGETLRTRLDRGGAAPSEVLAILASVARGLAAAHRAGIVHGDVKPENVLVGHDGRARLADFGLVGAPEGGTPRYCAPERRRGEPATARSDQYALARSFSETLFDGKAPRTRLHRVFLRAESADPARRFESVDDFADAVVRATRKRGRAALVLGAIAALVVITLGARAWFTRERPLAPGEFAWAELGTDDAAAEKRFYVALFGWRIREEVRPGVGLYTTFSNASGVVAGLYEITAEQKTRGVVPHLLSYVAVDDVDASVADAKRLGARILAPPHDVSTARVATLRDPTDASIALIHRTRNIGAADSASLGSVTWHLLETDDAARAATFYDSLPMLRRVSRRTTTEHSHWIAYVRVADCDATVNRATSLGASVVEAPNDEPPGRSAVLRDPDGIVFGVMTTR